MLQLLQSRLVPLLARLQRDDDGAAMVEYGLLIGLIALVVAVAAAVLGNDISTMFAAVGSYLNGLTSNIPS
jgi:pilus assembly protein Flp/PilA